MKRRIKKMTVIVPCIILAMVVISVLIYNFISYRNSNKYKLLEKGYTENEVNLLEKSLKHTDNILIMDYNKDILEFINKKHFIESNLSNYLKYYSNNKSNSIDEVIAIINIGRDKEIFKDSKKANTGLKELILVNKYNYLEKDYEPVGGLTLISNKYAYGENYVATDIYDYLKEMFIAASKDNVKLIVNSSYRDYDSQVATYSYFEHNRGSEYAKKYVAKPGYSEHQTGYALDIFAPNETSSTFQTSDAYNWLLENAYKYGFILRYPEDKEYLTDYSFEPWHYRYVGIEAAGIIEKENLSYEEYYTYYLK